MNRSFVVVVKSLLKQTSFSNTQKSFIRKLTTVNSNKELFRPLPSYLYNDPTVYQLERENIFGKNWIYAGRLDRLKKLGDYLSITIAGYPIFIYRSPLTNELIAFHNVCSHRAGPIVPINLNHYGTALYGNQSLLKCHYHAWLYDSRDGSLKATPNFNHKFQPEEKKCLSLKKINFEIFAEQFIFVNFSDTKEKPSINTLLHDLLNDMAHFTHNEHHHYETQYYLLNCNWKTFVENYQEGYHVHAVHPGLDNEIKAKEYVVTNKNNIYSIHYAPSNKQGNDQEKFLWVYIYPNLTLSLYDTYFGIDHILPIGKDQTLLAYDYFVRSSSDESQMKDRIATAKRAMIRTIDLMKEDKLICEYVQKNLDAGIYKPGYLSPSEENGVHFFQNRIRDELKNTKLQLE